MKALTIIANYSYIYQEMINNFKKDILQNKLNMFISLDSFVEKERKKTGLYLPIKETNQYNSMSSSYIQPNFNFFHNTLSIIEVKTVNEKTNKIFNHLTGGCDMEIFVEEIYPKYDNEIHRKLLTSDMLTIITVKQIDEYRKETMSYGIMRNELPTSTCCPLQYITVDITISQSISMNNSMVLSNSKYINNLLKNKKRVLNPFINM